MVKKSSTSSNAIEEIKIGNQIWMAKNLDVIHFNNGDEIPEAKDAEEWNNACNEKKPVWCYYDNDILNHEQFGRFYNLYAVLDSRGIAPVGWRVPSKSEWMSLVEFCGGIDYAGDKMKSTEGWEDSSIKNTDNKGKMTWSSVSGNGNNLSGLKLMPCGKCYDEGISGWAGSAGYYWSNPIIEDTNYIILQVTNGSKSVFWPPYNTDDGFSIRCIKSKNNDKNNIVESLVEKQASSNNVKIKNTEPASIDNSISKSNKLGNIVEGKAALNKNLYQVYFEISSDYEDESENIKKKIVAEFEAKTITQLKKLIEAEIESFEWDDSEVINHESKSELVCTNKEFLLAKDCFGKVILKQL